MVGPGRAIALPVTSVPPEYGYPLSWPVPARWGLEQASWLRVDHARSLPADRLRDPFAEASRDAFQTMLSARGYGAITTEIAPAGPFYYAEDYHQQYLDRNPRGYCPIHATGVKLPDDFVVTPLQYVD